MPDGSPRVVYHGTRSPIDFLAFTVGAVRDEHDQTVVTSARDPSAHLGPHFAESAQVASAFAEGSAASWDRSRYVRDSEDDDGEEPWAGGRVIPVYLAIRKPKVFKTDRSVFLWIVKHGDSSELDSQLEMDHGEDESVDFTSLDVKLEGLDSLAAATEAGDGETDLYDMALAELADSARDELRRQGYDGIKYRNDVEGGGWAWATLGTGQIKSALVVCPKYAPTDDSILV